MGVKDPKQAAEELFTRAMLEDTDFGSLTPSAGYTKARKFPKEADELLRDFLITDPVEALNKHLLASARRAEYVRRFGQKASPGDEFGSKLNDLFKDMAKDGFTHDEIDLIGQVVKLTTGQTQNLGKIDAGFGWLRVGGTLALLPKAVWSAFAEPFAAGIRTGNPLDGFTTMAGTLQHTLPEAWQSATIKEQAEMGRAIGIMGDSLNDQLLMQRSGGEYTTNRQTKILSAFFQRTGLHEYTQASRVSGMATGRAFVDTLVQRGLKGSKDAVQELVELGVHPDRLDDFAKWLGDLDGRPSIDDVSKAGAIGKDYITAISRFTDETIQMPNAIDRPIFSGTSYGRMMYGIMSFSFAFQRNVIQRSGKRLWKAFADDSISPLDRARIIGGTTAAIGTLIAAQTLVSTAREKVTNPERFNGLTVNDLGALGWSRTGGFGAFDPLFNAMTGVKYNRDLTSLTAGPYLSLFLSVGQVGGELIMRNSPNTNSAERKMIKNAYTSLLIPTVNAGFSLMPGGPILRTGAGLAMHAAATPYVKNRVTDAIAGPKQSSGRPRRTRRRRIRRSTR